MLMEQTELQEQAGVGDLVSTSSQSSQHTKRKESYLDIVTNPFDNHPSLDNKKFRWPSTPPTILTNEISYTISHLNDSSIVRPQQKQEEDPSSSSPIQRPNFIPSNGVSQSLPSFTSLFGVHHHPESFSAFKQFTETIGPTLSVPWQNHDRSNGVVPIIPVTHSNPSRTNSTLPIEVEPPASSPSVSPSAVTSSSGSGSGAPPIDPPTGRFILLEQPNEIQRKSYKNESRYLLPNPLAICLKSSNDKDHMLPITGGTVTVKLVNRDGGDLPGHDGVLESLGGLSHSLDDEKAASFSLKVLTTSNGGSFRLLFHVSYMEQLALIEEKILSNPFIVCSNRKKQLKELKDRLNNPASPAKEYLNRNVVSKK